MFSQQARFHVCARAMALALVVTGLAPVQAGAQTSTVSARELLRDSAILPGNLVDLLADEFSKALTIGIATAPASTSAAGFTYNFNEQTGERVLRSQSFGPLFVERPLTNGRGILNGGITFSRVNFSKFLGADIRTGIRTYDQRLLFLADNKVDFFRVDLALSPTVTTARTSLAYGVTESFDVGVVVPVSRFEMTVTNRVAYDFTGRDLRGNVPRYGSNSYTTDGTASKVGIGDVSLRAKYAFGASQPVAIAVDVRLPTGDEENFLGAGKVSTRIGISGARALSSMFTLTANGGYEAGGVTNIGFYRAAVDAALLSSKKLTVSAEFDGQYLSEAATDLVPREFQLSSYPIAGRSFAVEGRQIDQILSIGGVSLTRAAIGAKYNLFGRALVSAGVIFALNDAGISAPASAFLGFDLSLGGR